MKTGVNVLKGMVIFGLNLTVFLLGFVSVAILALMFARFDMASLLPAGRQVFYLNPDGAMDTFILSLVAANSLLIFGLLKLKSFIKRVEKSDLLTDATALSLKKGAILMLLVGILNGIGEHALYPNHIILDFSLAFWLFLLGMGLPYIRTFFRNMASLFLERKIRHNQKEQASLAFSAFRKEETMKENNYLKYALGFINVVLVLYILSLVGEAFCFCLV